MNTIKKTLILTTSLLAYSTVSFAGGPQTDDIFGTWSALTLQGDLKSLSPELDKVKWLVMNQARTRDDSPAGTRLSENLLFAQVGYQVTSNASIWAGYVHDWINPLGKPSYQESRPYQDFLWNSALGGDFKLLARTRLEERINETTGNVGIRPRQLIQLSHPLPILDGLSAYLGDEVFFYLNQNNFGKQGFSENRVLSGLSYQFTPKIGLDLGYLGQYVDNKTGNNLFTHNLQTNLRITF